MQLVNVANGGFHISREIWIYFVITIPLTILTMSCWLFGMWREQKRQKSSDSQDVRSEDAQDIERGIPEKSFN
jgi:hypothetical protein